MTLLQCLARYRALHAALMRGAVLAPWEHDEYQRLGKKLGPMILDA